ncbi:Hpt domain-containing protein [Oceanicoccus sp. KOV_DT_Chl]|uniref:Hpt domain-containing protein n=1 Tax=Oceanicoccus sp. KOV_DT_Chl TaxID=1904639 RepID=UPI000C7CAB8B|nr:Hpt domain-containing protein [Oceanicoccus sp. KOV_DT_Chl]
MEQATDHIDLEALKELQAVMGEEFSLLIDTFTSDSILRIEGIKAAVASADPEAIRRAAHSFKGSAGNMAAIRLTELCRSMEEIGFQGSSDGCAELLVSIEAEYEQVKTVLASL